MTGKTAIVGDGDSILVFKAAGVDAFPASDAKTARETLRRIGGSYSVIFLTEELAKELGAFLERFDEEPYPVVLTVPSREDGTGYGAEEIRRASERALGIDLFRND